VVAVAVAHHHALYKLNAYKKVKIFLQLNVLLLRADHVVAQADVTTAVAVVAAVKQ